MKVRILETQGQGFFTEGTWDKPDITDQEIEVQSVMTGVCRSDIDMMMGNFGPLPRHMQGHEGLGQVTKVGKYITDVKVGDYVATRGEPAYADFYNVKQKHYVRVPEASPRYIIEPVACGINLLVQSYIQVLNKSGPGSRCLILGSGFLSWVLYNTLSILDVNFEEVVVKGSHNKDLWKDKLSSDFQGKFDVIFDLSSDPLLFDKVKTNVQPLYIMGVEKTVTLNFSDLLWNAASIVFASPRSSCFHDSMLYATSFIKNNELNIDKFWTRGYNRDTEWQQAFVDGFERSKNYSRGYITWQ